MKRGANDVCDIICIFCNMCFGGFALAAVCYQAGLE